MKKVVILLTMISFAMSSGAHADVNEEILKELRALKARVIELEAKVDQYERKDMAHGHDDHSSEAEHLAGGHDDAKWGPFSGHDHSGLTSRDITVHGGVDLRYTDQQDVESDATLQEAEIAVEAKLADWLVGFVSVTKEDGEEAAVEEAYGEFLFDDYNVRAKAGKFFVPFGSLNEREFFDRRTITRSPVEEDMFGEEPWIDTGATAHFLVPEDLDDWTFQFIVGAFNGDNEASFGDDDENTSESNDNFPFLARYQQAYEGDSFSFTSGLSFAHGKSDVNEDLETQLKGVDLNLTIGSWDIEAEFIHRKKEENFNTVDWGYGFDISTSYFIPLNYKYVESMELLFAYGMSDPTESTEKTRYAPQISFGLTENTKLRFIYEFLEEEPTDTDNDRFITQFAFHF